MAEPVERKIARLGEVRAATGLVGHRAAEDVLLASWRSGRLAHAWLMHGPRGVGKATLAYRFARYVLAQGSLPREAFSEGEGMEIDPESRLFRRVAAGAHADLLTVEPGYDEKTGARRGEILVDDVRTVNAFLALTPGEGSWRAVIVDSADDLNRNAANALLKVLEEPPRRVVFLLLSARPSRLLPTIVSRCRRLALKPLAREEVVAFLRRRMPELRDDEAAAIAEISGGCPGRALELAENGGLELFREMLDLLDSLPKVEVVALHDLGDRVAPRGAEPAFRTLGELLPWWLARLIRYGAKGAVPPEIAPGEGALSRRLLARAELDQWVGVWEKLTRLFAEAERYNLDRKQVVLNAFGALEHAARR